MTVERAKVYVKRHCGDAFVRGVSIDLRRGTAKVVVRAEGGTEKETIISLPSGKTEYTTQV